MNIQVYHYINTIFMVIQDTIIHEGQMATLDIAVYIGLASSTQATQASSCISIG